MKLFVWNDPYSVAWGKSDLFVVAEDLDSARDQAKKAYISEYGHEPRYDTMISQLGEPNWVRDLPFAFAYEWSE